MQELYEHQRLAIEKLNSGAVLVGGVGTGKSRTALAYYYKKVCGVSTMPYKFDILPAPPIVKRLYIITTARKRDTKEWNSECLYFGLDCSGESSKSVIIDSWNNIKKYVNVTGAFFIFDEQRLVGTGAWVKAFLKIAKFNEWILLTATPGDTWLDYAPVFIANGFYKNITEFRCRHVVYHRYAKFPKVEKYIDIPRLERFRSAIVVSMEYHKETERVSRWIFCNYDKDLYKRAEKDRWNIYNNCPIQNKAELCYLLRKIVNSDHDRFSKLLDILSEHPKVILFYNFDYELEKLIYFAETVGITYSQWNGHKHEPLPVGERWIFLVQYLAGAEGWNCIETDTVVFYSLNYSYKTTVQASGRIDRMNTPFSTLYYYYICSRSSIDRAIKACLIKKKNFNERTFNTAFDISR